MDLYYKDSVNLKNEKNVNVVLRAFWCRTVFRQLNKWGRDARALSLYLLFH